MRKLWPKYKNWSKLGTEHQVYWYTPKVYRYTLAKNDQNPKCTGTCSRCTGTLHPKMPRMCIFSPFSCTFIHGSLLYFLHTSKSFHIALVTYFLLNSSFNTYLISKTYHGILPKQFEYGSHPIHDPIIESC